MKKNKVAFTWREGSGYFTFMAFCAEFVSFALFMKYGYETSILNYCIWISLPILCPIIAGYWLYARNTTGRMDWVDLIVIPDLPFEISSSLNLTKVSFDENGITMTQLGIAINNKSSPAKEPKLFSSSNPVKSMSYSDIKSVIVNRSYAGSGSDDICLHNTREIWKNHLVLWIPTSWFSRQDWVLILKTLRKYAPDAEYNNTAQKYLDGYFY